MEDIILESQLDEFLLSRVTPSEIDHTGVPIGTIFNAVAARFSNTSPQDLLVKTLESIGRLYLNGSATLTKVLVSEPGKRQTQNVGSDELDEVLHDPLTWVVIPGREASARVLLGRMTPSSRFPSKIGWKDGALVGSVVIGSFEKKDHSEIASIKLFFQTGSKRACRAAPFSVLPIS